METKYANIEKKKTTTERFYRKCGPWKTLQSAVIMRRQHPHCILLEERDPGSCEAPAAKKLQSRYQDVNALIFTGGYCVALECVAAASQRFSFVQARKQQQILGPVASVPNLSF